MSDTKKYYWLKLKRDFFKRHDTKIIESMENGEKYLLFYLKLLVESLDHDGNLRFSDTVTYNEKMLSAITSTDIDIVRSAVKIFTELNMMEQLDDGTLYMTQVLAMTGDESKWAEQKRLYREGQKKTMSDKSIEYRDKSIEIRDKIKIEDTPDKPAKPIKPQKTKYGTFNNVLLTDDEQKRLVQDFQDKAMLAVQYLSEYKEEKGYTSKNDNLTIRRWVIDAVKKKELQDSKPCYNKSEPYRFNPKDFEK